MNERIKELAEQSRKHFPKTETSGEFWVFDEQKFAELIIKECASLTLDYGGPDHYTGWLDYRDEIKKHFGIEE